MGKNEAAAKKRYIYFSQSIRVKFRAQTTGAHPAKWLCCPGANRRVSLFTQISNIVLIFFQAFRTTFSARQHIIEQNSESVQIAQRTNTHRHTCALHSSGTMSVQKHPNNNEESLPAADNTLPTLQGIRLEVSGCVTPPPNTDTVLPPPPAPTASTSTSTPSPPKIHRKEGRLSVSFLFSFSFIYIYIYIHMNTHTQTNTHTDTHKHIGFESF